MYVSGVLHKVPRRVEGVVLRIALDQRACSNTVVAFLLCVLCSTQRALGSLLQQRIYGEVVSCDSEAGISINYVPDEENPNFFVWQDGSRKQSGQLTYHVLRHGDAPLVSIVPFSASP
jgi:hypothetical protein